MVKHLPQNVGLRARVAELAGSDTGKIVTVGVATVVLAPIVLPLVRPMVKATIKTGVIAFEKTKYAIAETGEILADIAAEAKAEARAESLKVIAVQPSMSTESAQASPNES